MLQLLQILIQGAELIEGGDPDQGAAGKQAGSGGGGDEGAGGTAAKKQGKSSSSKKSGVLIDLSMAEHLFGIAQGNISSVIDIMKKLESDSNKVTFISKLVEEVKSLGVFGNTKISDVVLPAQQNKSDDEMNNIMKRIQEGKATSKDLFKAIDDEVN